MIISGATTFYLGVFEEMSTTSGQFDFNHWLLRLIAYIIDAIIIAIPTWIVWFLITLSAAVSGSYLFLAWGVWLIFPFIWGIIQVLYFAILDVYWGATIGKRILGFRVQMTNGERVPFDKAFIRNISKIYPLFLFLDWIIGVATAGPDRRQKWTDRIAGTTVVPIRQPFTSPTTTTSTPPPPPPPPPT